MTELLVSEGQVHPWGGLKGNHAAWQWTLSCTCARPSHSSTLVETPVTLCDGECVPVADLLAFSLLHLCPVGLLLLAGAVEAQRDPAQPLPGPHAAAGAEHRQDQRYLRELEERHLEQEGLLVGGVGLAAAHRCLTLGHFFAFGV